MAYNYQQINERVVDGIYNTKLSYPTRDSSYSHRHIFDEEKSVRWNREMVEQKKLEYKTLISNFRDDVRNLEKLFELDVTEFLKDEFNFNESVARKVYKEAWSGGHSGGYNEVLSDAVEISDWVSEILKSYKENEG